MLPCGGCIAEGVYFEVRLRTFRDRKVASWEMAGMWSGSCDTWNAYLHVPACYFWVLCMRSPHCGDTTWMKSRKPKRSFYKSLPHATVPHHSEWKNDFPKWTKLSPFRCGIFDHLYNISEAVFCFLCTIGSAAPLKDSVYSKERYIS